MAISKILNMKDCGGHFHGKHLKRSLDYVMNPEKTQDGRLVGAINCQADAAFEQMKETKRKFGKVDKRQGYHIILSFKENEVNPDTAFEITQRFVEEYLGKSYEAIYVVHDNTEHVHSHIVFNSVSFVDGKKYRYEKGDWAKYIQPITNRLCEEYGLSIIDVDDGSKEKQHESYKDWSEYREGSFVWADMIKRDLDACILQAGDYQQFLDLLSDKGYTIKQGKYLAVKPQGMTRFRRCKTLGDMYSDEAIRERISNEDISFYREKQEEIKPVLIRCKVKRYRKAKMSGLQKRYYAKLYRIGKLKKRPYSQAWKYKDDIRRMHKLQKEYLFLANHDIHSAEELVSVISSLTDKRKEVSSEKSRIYKARERSRELFDIADEMQELKPAEQSYIQGDEFFEDEHIKWEMLKQKLLSQGYTLDEVEALRKHYKEEYSQACAKERAVFKELNIGKSIWKSLISDNVSNGKDTEYNKETIRDRKEQPVR
ncbi:relaxase/mobilization nuclease domain-containing protein [Agathobacter sp. LCP21S3_B2]|uniref:relaxase/mobilization nuclease domain-containing protein n=1 Tax=Agathobacter sp. LCP21S3_B2 TaxID=3438734 RepID=UPI003F917B61